MLAAKTVTHKSFPTGGRYLSDMLFCTVPESVPNMKCHMVKKKGTSHRFLYVRKCVSAPGTAGTTTGIEVCSAGTGRDVDAGKC